MHRAHRRVTVAGAFVVSALPALALGGVHPTTIALSAAAAWAFFAYVAFWRIRIERRPLRLGLVGVAMVTATAFCALQLVPLPPGLLSLLSPKGAELLDFTVGPFGLFGDGAWMPVSLDPPATALELVRISGLTAAYLAARNGFVDRRDMGQALLAIVAIGVVIFAIGVFHTVTGSQKILGVYAAPLAQNTLFVSTFVNRNHLAGFLLFGALLAFGVAFSEESRRSTRVAVAMAGFLMVAGTVLTLSRAGIAALGVGVVLLLLLLFRAKAAQYRRLGWIFLIGLAAAGAAAAFGWERLLHRFGQTDLTTDLKVQMWKDTLPMLLDFGRAGVGHGAFPVTFPLYQSNLAQYTYTHVESFPLQIGVDFGLVVGGFLLVALVLRFGRLLFRRLSSSMAGAVAGLSALFLHNLADYNLEIGGVAYTAAIVLGLVLRRERPSRAAAGSPWRPRTFVALAAALFFAGAIVYGSVYGRAEHKDRAVERVRAAAGDAAAIESAAVRELRHHPADYLVFLAAAARLGEPPVADVRRAIRFANRALYLNGAAHQTHLLTARLLLRLGRPSQAVIELRLAARRHPDLWERAFLELSRLPSSLRWLEELADEPAARLRLTHFLHAYGRDDEALALAKRLLTTSPKDGDALLLAARIQLARKQFDEAAAFAQRLAALPGREGEAELLRGDAHAGAGREADALADWARARQKAPTLAAAYLHAAAIHLQRKEGKPARELLEALLRVDVRTAASSHFSLLLGQAHEMEGQLRKALREYRLALAREPKNGFAKARVEALEKVTDLTGTP